eukprot:1102845-Amorphochlora_amoeboformis.AAC.1
MLDCGLWITVDYCGLLWITVDCALWIVHCGLCIVDCALWIVRCGGLWIVKMGGGVWIVGMGGGVWIGVLVRTISTLSRS